MFLWRGIRLPDCQHLPFGNLTPALPDWESDGLAAGQAPRRPKVGAGFRVVAAQPWRSFANAFGFNGSPVANLVSSFHVLVRPGSKTFFRMNWPTFFSPT